MDLYLNYEKDQYIGRFLFILDVQLPFFETNFTQVASGSALGSSIESTMNHTLANTTGYLDLQSIMEAVVLVALLH